MHRATTPLIAGLSVCVLVAPSAAHATEQPQQPVAVRLATGLAGGTGSTIGPDGAVYVAESVAGRIARVDPTSGQVTTYASGLPQQNPAIGLGGVMDVAFVGRTAYALVTLVGSDTGGNDVVGIYRVDPPGDAVPVADIGAFAIAHPPATDFFVPSGLQYAFEPFRGGFLVTDGHHNRVLRVSRDGQVSQLLALGNVVPTGLAVRGDTVFLAEAGPLPHLPADGTVVSFRPGADTVTEVASGGPLLVDVEFGRGRTLLALSQGVWPLGGPAGSPAQPDTGALLRADDDGTFTTVLSGLDRPTSLEYRGNTAFVVTLTGEVWRIDGVGRAHHDSD